MQFSIFLSPCNLHNLVQVMLWQVQHLLQQTEIWRVSEVLCYIVVDITVSDGTALSPQATCRPPSWLKWATFSQNPTFAIWYLRSEMEFKDVGSGTIWLVNGLTASECIAWIHVLWCTWWPQVAYKLRSLKFLPFSLSWHWGYLWNQSLQRVCHWHSTWFHIVLYHCTCYLRT